MKFHILIMVVLSATFLPKMYSQISPGDLTKAHAELEGMTNCTQCHVLGKSVSNDKCLACHKEIQSRIDGQKGYHVSKEVKGKDCASCHSEHHGRNFEMVRFDEDNFNHNLTGYELTGKHEVVDCRQCHLPDFIDNRDLKKRAETFLGLNTECKSCHEDYHQNTLSKDCTTCHTTADFSPATKFNHKDTDFALLGKHNEIACIECHQMEVKNGRDFQRFTGIEFTNCNSCHKDAHQNNLGTNCKVCHNEQSFSSLTGLKKYNHNQTNFPLKGAHQQLNCSQCHEMDATPISIFQDKLGLATDNCISCHEDVHDQKFGSNCVECHHETSFRQVSMNNFDHGKTDFDLRGKHAIVDCRQCHTESFTEPLVYNECAACHVDYHEGQFISNNLSTDCATCHTEEGFDNTLFTIEAHQESKFPLDGAHLATPCFACHLKEEKWQFREIGESCVDCHEDVHQGFIDQKYYPNQSCETCHLTASWEENQFDHNLTEFKLLGVHADQKCMNCHNKDDENQDNRYQGFVNLSVACASCHDNVHEQQFEKEGVTDCARCHGFESWGLQDFNHDNTAFKLEGKHATIACTDCHKPIEVDGKIFTQYKFESFECVVCHQ